MDDEMRAVLLAPLVASAMFGVLTGALGVKREQDSLVVLGSLLAGVVVGLAVALYTV